jgi:aminoglycoside 3-N-acetyltransferase
MEVYEGLKKSLETLGIERGDVVLLKADLSEIGLVAGSPKASRDMVFNVLWDVLGGPAEGTLITSSFTEIFFNWQKSDYVFEASTPSKSGGAITKYFLQHPGVFRSKHPTNSFVAVGKHAPFLTEGHDETSHQYDPVGKVIELNGKALSLGTVAAPPDFMTGHYAQQEAGLTARTILKYLTGVKYKKGNEVKTFKVSEAGGCSRGHYLVYAHYVTSKKLRTAYFGKAYSISMPAKDAFEISLDLQRRNPRSFLCNDPACFSCRATWFWNWQDWPGYYFRNFIPLLRKAIQGK